MPAKNSLKIYVDDGYYHIYNRGVNKMDIFHDTQDYAVFLSYLKSYLLPKDTAALMKIITGSDTSAKEKNQAKNELKRNNFSDTITLAAYCLMPNHFHFLIKTKEGRVLEKFMKSLMTRYTKYYNTRYNRVGPLFQGRYKAVLVGSDEQLLHLTRYIHRNPFKSKKSRTVPDTQPSSYPVYLGEITQSWVNSKDVLHHFAKSGFNSYQSFVEDNDADLQEQTTHFLPYLHN